MRVPELRPLAVGEILDVSIKLYLHHALILIKIVAIFVVPISLLSFLVILSAAPDGTFVREGQVFVPTEDDLNSLLAGSFFAVLLGGVGTLLATGAAFRAVGDAYLGRTPDAGRSLSFAGRRFFSFLWVSILVIIVIGIGFLLLVVPGIYLMVALSVTVPALLLEDVRGGKALSRSRELVKGRWWPALGTLLLGIVLIPAVVSFVIDLLFNAVLIGDVDGVTSFFFLGSIADILNGIITTPIQVAVVTVLYFDLRVRKEGFDLELLARQIGAASDTSSWTPPDGEPPQPAPPPGL
ncbi:MAG TPA: hypothetical protein VFA00_02030 [Actinomycetota bacterium]|jgi:hypothetical protein|nr:hypothetical protein [Actinomycetota bacterium]